MDAVGDKSVDAKGTWWSRPAGGREVLAVALPLVVSSLSWTVMTFIDRIFLKWESGEAMSAAFAASTAWFAAMCFPLGLTMYTSTFVSQYYGAERFERIGRAVWQGVWLAVACCPILLVAIPVAPHLFAAADHSAAVQDMEISYFQILCFGGPALWIAQALSAFYSGRGKTSVVMGVDAVGAGANVLLDWLMIFGHWGLPAMGIEGAGWATVIAMWLKVAIYLVLVLRRTHRQTFGTLSGLRPHGELLRRMIRYGVPSGLQMQLDIVGFTMFVMMIGRLGLVESEASSMAFSISMLAFTPVWGLSLATSILVGQHLGEERADLAARSTWTLLAMAIAYMVAISSMYLFVPGWFLGVFFLHADVALGESGLDAMNAATQQEVYALATRLLQFVAAFNLLDAVGLVFVGALKGAGDTRFVLKVSVVLGTSLAVLSWLAVEKWALDIHGCWVLITAWVWVMGMSFLWRFLGGRWRSMRVIEPPAPDLPAEGGGGRVEA